jgi:Predicted membrane protein (DUF2231)
MPETIGGLPLHVLVVHATVVLLPLAAVGVIAVAAVPRIRAALGLSTLVLTVVAVALVPITKESGENFREEIGGGPLVARHADLGGTLLYFAIPLLVIAVVLWWMGHREKGRNSSVGVLSVLVSVVAIGIALATIVQVVRIGHSGSEAVWSGIVASGTTGQQQAQ